MLLSRRDFLACLAGLSTLPASAADMPRLAAGDLRADLALLQRVYGLLHPGLHRYARPAEIDAHFAALDRAWREPRSLPEAYLALSLLLSTVRCGHTYANFYNQRRQVQQALFGGRDKLPFHFEWVGTQMVVMGASAELAPGTEVLAIDGLPAAQLLARLEPAVRADGHVDAMKRALLSVTGGDEFETFDVFFPLVAGARERFVLDVRAPDGASRRTELAAIDLAQRRAAMPRRAPPSDETPPWPLVIEADGTAVLTMPGWAMYNTRWDWRAYLGRVLADLAERRAPSLVIDLRGNEGGLDCGDEIIARLIERPVEVRLTERRVRYRRVPADLNPVLDTWNDGFRDWGDAAQPLGDGFFRLADGPAQRIEPKGPRYRGRVAVLVDGSNHSATFRFVQIVQRERLGLLVGPGTGGNLRGSNGGAFFFVRLPATGLEVDLPLIGAYAPGEPPDAALPPDVVVSPTVADLAAGRDVVLSRARAALRT
jgi:Peptidase family S41